jgi:mRNA interferase RelE/StbE
MKLLVSAAALKTMSKMPRHDANALRTKLMTFAADPFGAHSWAKHLVGMTGVRIRHGDWRAICEVNDTALVVTVVKVGHRREVYR